MLRCHAKKNKTETHFFNFTSDVHNKFHTELSQQHYPESTIFEDTRRISHTMIINYPRNPYDGNDSRSWKQKETFEEESLFEDIVCYVLYWIVGVL